MSAIFLFILSNTACVNNNESKPGITALESPEMVTASPETALTPTNTKDPDPVIPAPTVSILTFPGSWSQGTNMLSNRSEMPAVVLTGLIYVPGGFGGQQNLEVYNPELDSWASLADMPEGRHHVMAAGYNGRLYVFGGASSSGWEPTNTTWVYDPITEGWSELAPMPERRVAGAAVTIGDFIYVVGGTGGSRSLLQFNPLENTWTQLAEHEHPREHTAAVALDGMIYLLGGRWQTPGELDTVEIYDPVEDAWRMGPALPGPRAGFGAAVFEGKIVVLGGEIIIDGNDTFDSVRVFDPVSQEWIEAPSMPFPLHGVPAAVVDNQLFVLGGADVAGTANNSGRTLIFTPE